MNETPNDNPANTPSGRAKAADAVIAPGRTVTLHLDVRFQDGFVALSTQDEEPLTCTIGDGTLTEALESTLMGLAVGSDTHIVGQGSELFSPYDESNIHWMDRSEFPPGIAPARGLVVGFQTPGGHETSGVIQEVEAQRVQVDFNHPFSGRSVTIRVRVLAIT